jgi:peptidyl-tRNA hydrolase, PTH1 family
VPGLALRLFAGLGNPGREYEQTRHNAGFWLADELARRHGGTWRTETRFNAMLAKVGIAGSELWLVKPLAYMNRSGGVTAAVANFYRIDARDILVAHDELDLSVGVVRLKESGGAGGHNGLKDLIAQFGDGFWRLRLGIGHPGSRDLVSGYVLNRAPASEQQLLDDATRAAADIVPVLLRDGAQPAMQKLHTRES